MPDTQACSTCQVWHAVAFDVVGQDLGGRPAYEPTGGNCPLRGWTGAAESCPEYRPKPPLQPTEVQP